MGTNRPLLTRLSLAAAIISAVTIMSLGGCPQPQQPGNPPADDDQQNQRLTSNNQREDERPVPQPPIEDLEDGTDGLPGGSSNGGGSSGGGGGGGGEEEPPPDDIRKNLRVVILAPLGDRELLRNAPVDVKYRVDGDAESIELLVTLEGGEAEVVSSGLNVEGTVQFSSLEPGKYQVAIRASNSSGSTVGVAPASITVVGDMKFTFTKPASDLIIRPNVPVQIAYSVDTLAQSIQASLYLDPNRAQDGDEILMKTSTLKSFSDTIGTQDLDIGVSYSIYVEATDSVGQSSGRVFAPHTIRVVPAPTIRVDGPVGDGTIKAGDPVVVTFEGVDTENLATITVFVDNDGIFNGDEDDIGVGLPIGTTEFTVDTSTFAAGTYYFGAKVVDDDDIHDIDYAPGTRTLPGIRIDSPASDRSISPPQTVGVAWTATYPASAFKAHEIVVAEDFDNDKKPDGALVVAAAGFSPGSNNFDLSTFGLKGRHLVGVRLIDNNDAEIVAWARGEIIVSNEPPQVVINDPSERIAVRPNTPAAIIRMRFNVFDAENVLKQNGGIAVVVARDDDFDGVPDGDPVYEETSNSFRVGNNDYQFDATALFDAGLISGQAHDGYGEFLLGVRVLDDAEQEAIAWISGGLYVDNVEPTIALDDPSAKLVTKDRIGELRVQLTVSDTSPTFVAVLLDRDPNPDNAFDGYVLIEDVFGPNDTREFVIDLTTVPPGFYYWYLVVTDGVFPFTQHYLPPDAENPDDMRNLWIRDRLIGRINVADLEKEGSNGAILTGFNFNDLAGSSMDSVPDVDRDGDDELVIVSRYGKPFIINNDIGVGFGEAYLIYGNNGNNNGNNERIRLQGRQTLNAVGRGKIPGLSFPGIRIPLDKTWTEGISDVAIVPDMDGDDLPEMVFSFPRAESLNLGTTDTSFQHPELLPDISGMGELEYNALTPFGWELDRAQFTRGGIVIVSSHNINIPNENIRNRKFDRLIDLHEIGQMFTDMSRPTLVPYVIGAGPDDPPVFEFDCDNDGTPELVGPRWVVFWDVVFNNQGPGGFQQPWTAVAADPPLANPSSHPPPPPYIFYPDNVVDCMNPDPPCEWRSVPFIWPPQPLGPFPCSNRSDVSMWDVGGMTSHWTGFYGSSTPEVQIRQYSIGARVLGQEMDDRFGSSVSTDGTWLYISAPRHTPTKADVPLMPQDERPYAGTVYMYRVDARVSENAPTRSQLWMEPFTFDDGEGNITIGQWPVLDAEIPGRSDTTMPVPHQYIIESVGSVRGDPNAFCGERVCEYDFQTNGCPPSYNAGDGGAQANAASSCYQPYPVGTSGFYMDRTPQIVGPHVEARISFVRAVGDINDDGIQDFAVGSDRIRQDFSDPQNPTGPVVGGVFIVHGRSTGLEGDYLLDELALAPDDNRRLNGILLKGEADQPIARVFDGAGDFNGDGIDDIVVGSELGSDGRGEAIVILGSRTLLSPEGGYTLEQIVNDKRAIRFVGAQVGDLAGANVAGAGDVDGDGFGDILIAAPNAGIDSGGGKPKKQGERGGSRTATGLVYLIYGSTDHVPSVIDLAKVGTSELPGVVFVGRNVDDALGGGEVELVVNPDGQPTKIYSRGVAALGDIDGDGRDDYSISAILADPFGKTNAGEVYIIYGKGDEGPN